MAVIFGVAYYFVALDSRISTLEGQVRLIATAPAISQPSVGTVEQGVTYTTVTIPNPLVQTCMDLYARVGNAVQVADRKVQDSLNGYMRELGCADVIKATK